jgi:hypothetical protein
MLHSAPALTKHDLLFGVVGSNGPGTQFTYFTSTKVQILTPEELLAFYLESIKLNLFNSIGSLAVGLDILHATSLSRYSVYLLYWCKSTNTDVDWLPCRGPRHTAYDES